MKFKVGDRVRIINKQLSIIDIQEGDEGVITRISPSPIERDSVGVTFKDNSFWYIETEYLEPAYPTMLNLGDLVEDKLGNICEVRGIRLHVNNRGKHKRVYSLENPDYEYKRIIFLTETYTLKTKRENDGDYFVIFMNDKAERFTQITKRFKDYDSAESYGNSITSDKDGGYELNYSQIVWFDIMKFNVKSNIIV